MPNKQTPNIEGEGSYEGTKDYNDRTKRFLDREGDQVEDMAEDAAEDVDDDQLTDAEKAGLKKSKH